LAALREQMVTSDSIRGSHVRSGEVRTVRAVKKGKTFRLF
jgi:hypothetical protein